MAPNTTSMKGMILARGSCLNAKKANTNHMKACTGRKLFQYTLCLKKLNCEGEYVTVRYSKPMAPMSATTPAKGNQRFGNKHTTTAMVKRTGMHMPQNLALTDIFKTKEFFL